MADCTWNGSKDGNLSDADNWDTLPTSADNVTIGEDGTAPSSGTCEANYILISRSSIGGGTYTAPTIYGACSISGGTFNGALYLSGPYEISGGVFNGYVETYGAISNGTFNGSVSVYTSLISGGHFYNSVGGLGYTISNGTFESTVINSLDISGGTFYGATNSSGTMSGGIFYGDFTWYGINLYGATFYGKFTNGGESSSLNAGTFYGEVVLNQGYAQMASLDLSAVPKITISNTTYTKAKGINGSSILGLM